MSSVICGFVVEKNPHLATTMYDSMSKEQVIEALEAPSGIGVSCGFYDKECRRKIINEDAPLWIMTLFNDQGVNNMRIRLAASSFKKLMIALAAGIECEPDRFNFKKGVKPGVAFTSRNVDFMVRKDPYLKLAFNEFLQWMPTLAESVELRQVREERFLSRTAYHTAVAVNTVWTGQVGDPDVETLTGYDCNVEPIIQMILSYDPRY